MWTLPLKERIVLPLRPPFLSLLAFLALALALAFGSPAALAAPALITYSGRLTDGTGWGQSLLVDLEFRVYGAEVGGDSLWYQTYPGAAVEDGFFTVLLDVGAGSSGHISGVFASTQQTWLEVVVEGTELARQRIGSVPYALVAESARTVIRPSLSPDETYNLAWYRSADGVVSIRGADGSDLSSESPGWVSVPSVLNPGGHVTLAVETGWQFHDDGHSGSHLGAAWSFGVTSGRKWDYWMPVGIYIVNTDDTSAGLRFALSRSPVMRVLPGPESLGDLDTMPAGAGSQSDVFIIGQVDLYDYAGKPALLIGATEMKRPTDTSGWRLQDSDVQLGIGSSRIEHVFSQTYSFPLGQNGNAPGKLFASQGGTTALSFGSYIGKYTVHRDGDIAYRLLCYFMTVNGGTSDSLNIFLPYARVDHDSSSLYMLSGGGAMTLGGVGVTAFIRGASASFVNLQTGTGAAINAGSFNNSSDFMDFSMRYKAF